MYFKAITASVFLFILSSSFYIKKTAVTFAKAKIVGVYDRDSLLNDIPAYRQEADSIIAQKKQMDAQRVLMYEELARKRNELYRDSATTRPIVKQIKQDELAEMRMNIAEFSVFANQETSARWNANYHRFDDLMKSAAAVVAKNKGVETVIDKKELIEYKKTNSSVKAKNVTNDMRVQLGLAK